MIVKSLVFSLIVYGFAIVIALCVAVIIKGIALFVQRGKSSAPAGKPTE